MDEGASLRVARVLTGLSPASSKEGNAVKKVLAVLLGIMVMAGLVAVSQTAVTPRDYSVLLFDNATGATTAKLALSFDAEVVLSADDIVVIGGEAVGSVASSTTFVFISVVVYPGGTLQLVLPPEYAGVTLTKAFWFE